VVRLPAPELRRGAFRRELLLRLPIMRHVKRRRARRAQCWPALFCQRHAVAGDRAAPATVTPLALCSGPLAQNRQNRERRRWEIHVHIIRAPMPTRRAPL